jgi:hypothetical protein
MDIQTQASGAAEIESCDNCSARLVGRFCHECGASPASAADKTMRAFFADAGRELTDVEQSKLLRTLHALLLKPGLLTRENFGARRIRYLKPLNLFFLSFGLNLLVYAAWTGVSLYDIRPTVAAAQQSSGDAPSMATLLKQASARQGISVEAMYERVNENWRQNASFSQIPMVLLFALLLRLIYRGRFFVEHLTFSLHYFAFQVLTNVLMWPIYFVVGIQPGPISLLVAVTKYLIDGTYLYLASKAYFGGSGAGAAGRAIAMLIGYYVVYLTAHAASMMIAIAAAARG